VKRADTDAVVIDVADDFGGKTKAHAGVPADPKLPAPVSRVVIDAPIAELFQDMLWHAFKAGAECGSPTRIAFEAWYESEVLR
jgi:hypothetical protein